MKRNILSATYLSSFCLELHLLIKAGIPVSEGFNILAEDETDKDSKALLAELYKKTDLGTELHAAIAEQERFPSYMVNMIEIGERTGNLDSVLYALSEYYDRQEQIVRSVKNAVLYPTILLLMMLFVVTILITRVLPVFNDVFSQLGGTMSPVAVGIMGIGLAINRNWGLILIVLAIVVVGGFVLYLRGKDRDILARLGLFKRLRDKIYAARFAAVIAMTMKIGLDPDESLNMAEKLVPNPAMAARVKRCKELITEGGSFAGAVANAEILPKAQCRTLEIGFRTGSADTVMDDIARRGESDVQDSIESLVGKVEPTLVVIMSVIVGLVLLSVMIPLMGIMSSIG
ncbi:MAG: type II secretion system F family protein [Peptococcaceae bacterium]|nr:type II secretion system F family protein [Peptococcaceae bacterium]